MSDDYTSNVHAAASPPISVELAGHTETIGDYSQFRRCSVASTGITFIHDSWFERAWSDDAPKSFIPPPATMADTFFIDTHLNSSAPMEGQEISITAIIDKAAPTVQSFNPRDNSTGVAVNSDIIVTFNEAVQRGRGSIDIHIGSVTGTIIEHFDAAISKKLSFSGNTLTIDPTLDLTGNTHYFVTIGSGTVKDLAGNGYAGSSSYDFTTFARDTTAPTVQTFSPKDNAIGVGMSSNIALTFSEAIQRGSGSIDIHIGSATGTIIEHFDAATSNRLSISGNTLTIDPSADLTSKTHYYVTFGNGIVKDLAGNDYAGSSSYDFTTVLVGTSTWDPVSGRGLLNIDAMLETATGKTLADAPLFGDGTGATDWAENDIKAPNAWQAGYTGKGVIVAVVDTGVNYNHSDLAKNIWVNKHEIAGNGLDDDNNGYVDDIFGYDFVNKDGYALDDNGHGSHVSGIIASINNGEGSTGIAYDATIMPVKVLDATGSGSFTNVANGIMYAVNNGANVINLSLGASGASSTAVSNALTYAINHGVIVCMASGNDSQNSPAYPAVLSETTGGIAVGAVDKSNVVSALSDDAGSVASYDFVVAPGIGIYSTSLGSGYTTLSGTSMATPMVSGAAALLLSAQQSFSTPWTLEQLENLITMTAQPLSSTSSTASATTLSTKAISTSSAYASQESTISLLGFTDIPVIDGMASLVGTPTVEATEAVLMVA